MSAGGNNATISFPGNDWQMLYPDGFPSWQLDIVGFLAILGESSILANAQVSALSRLFYLPRLLPAPQALLRVSRPDTLPPVSAHVTAVVSGNNKNHVHHVASVLLGTSSDQLKKHWVRVVSVTKKKDTKRATFITSFIDKWFRGTSKQTTEPTIDKDGVTHYEPIPATIKAKAAGPLTWVTLLSAGLTGIIFIVSIVFGDTMSLTALLCLSLLSTICGVANKWELNLPARARNADTLKDDQVVIRYPEGSFLIVKCNDEIARELFFAPEEIAYQIKSPQTYRILALVGSLLLMLGVILLANARLELQFAYLGAYLILNAAHWAAAALPAKMHWDLSCYRVQEEGILGGPTNSSFTEALWKVILVTKSTRWVRHNEAAPNTNTWNTWLKQARKAAIYAPGPKAGDMTDPIPEWCENGTKGEIHIPPNSFDAKRAYNLLSEQHLDHEDDEELSAAEDGEAFNSEKDTVVGAIEVHSGSSNGSTK